jgi:hypothetical protein
MWMEARRFSEMWPVSQIGKKVALGALLTLLVLLELYICTAFLSMEWQNAINKYIPQIFPESRGDWTPITHPLLNQEIEQVIREHIWLRITLYALTVGLLAANAWLIRRVWRLLRNRSVVSADRS